MIANNSKHSHEDELYSVDPQINDKENIKEDNKHSKD